MPIALTCINSARFREKHELHAIGIVSQCVERYGLTSFANPRDCCWGSRGRRFKSCRPDGKHNRPSRSIVRSCFALKDTGLQWRCQKRSQPFNATPRNQFCRTSSWDSGASRSQSFRRRPLPASHRSPSSSPADFRPRRGGAKCRTSRSSSLPRSGGPQRSRSSTGPDCQVVLASCRRAVQQDLAPGGITCGSASMKQFCQLKSYCGNIEQHLVLASGVVQLVAERFAAHVHVRET